VPTETKIVTRKVRVKVEKVGAESRVRKSNQNSERVENVLASDPEADGGAAASS
jgi:hypothetical protein